MSAATGPDPRMFEHVLQMAFGYMPAICMNVVTQLGVPDRLVNGPRAIDELAADVGADADALYRTMRALASVGVFEEASPRRFTNTPASALLADEPGSLRDMVLWMANPFHLRAYANLMHAVRTGENVSEITVGKPAFEYLQSSPEESAVFNRAMVGLTGMFMPAVLESYDFGSIRTLVDVGGGLGSVVAAVLGRYPEMRGVLVDLPHVASDASAFLASQGVADRCEIVAGNFFESVPPGGDAYIMKHIIHDWDDSRAGTILKNIREAIGDRAETRLLLIESVIAPGNQPDLGKWADIEMLALPGGRERTEDEFRQLLAAGGFTRTRFVPTQSPAVVIEAYPART